MGVLGRTVRDAYFFCIRPRVGPSAYLTLQSRTSHNGPSPGMRAAMRDFPVPSASNQVLGYFARNFLIFLCERIAPGGEHVKNSLEDECQAAA